MIYIYRERNRDIAKQRGRDRQREAVMYIYRERQRDRDIAKRRGRDREAGKGERGRGAVMYI